MRQDCLEGGRARLKAPYTYPNIFSKRALTSRACERSKPCTAKASVRLNATPFAPASSSLTSTQCSHHCTYLRQAVTMTHKNYTPRKQKKTYRRHRPITNPFLTTTEGRPAVAQCLPLCEGMGGRVSHAHRIQWPPGRACCRLTSPMTTPSDESIARACQADTRTLSLLTCKLPPKQAALFVPSANSLP